MIEKSLREGPSKLNRQNPEEESCISEILFRIFLYSPAFRQHKNRVLHFIDLCNAAKALAMIDFKTPLVIQGLSMQLVHIESKTEEHEFCRDIHMATSQESSESHIFFQNTKCALHLNGSVDSQHYAPWRLNIRMGKCS